MIMIDSAGAGDIVSMAGLASPSIGHTVANVEVCLFSTFSFFCHAYFFCSLPDQNQSSVLLFRLFWIHLLSGS